MGGLWERLKLLLELILMGLRVKSLRLFVQSLLMLLLVEDWLTIDWRSFQEVSLLLKLDTTIVLFLW